ncbi:MAG: GC-type dockerin domain-anchored protein [Planctomycetota bacterium]
MNRIKMMMMLAAAGTTCTVAAQDSVAPAGGFTDALDAYSTSQQIVEYVVDLDTFFSSKGKSFGIAPVVKASAEASGSFPTLLISSNGLSRLRSSTFAGQLDGPYATWSTAGAGVNDAVNSGSISFESVPNDAVYLGLGFGEFNGAVNNTIAAQIGYSPADPSRLFVTRVNAAVNSSTNGASDSSQFGFGAVDEDLNVYFRADSFNSTGPNTITGNNIFRVDAANRNGAFVNSIDNSGGSDSAATDDVLRGNGTTHSIPSAVPVGVGGPAYFGPNFSSQLRFETGPGATSITLDQLGGAVDHRGGIGVLPEPFFAPGDAITAAIGTQEPIFNPATEEFNDETVSISVWGADSNGEPTAPATQHILPDTIADPAEGIDLFPQELIHFSGGTAFRGGSSQIALGTTLGGDLLLAGTAALQSAPGMLGGGDAASEIVGITVARFTSPGAAPEWSMASWLDPNTGIGKPFTDENGVEFAQLGNRNSIPGAGPGTASAAAFDSAGNIYFVQPVRLYGDDGQPFTGDDFVTTSVIRANYVADADGQGNFGYDLEVLFDFGSTFSSAGTGLDYQITFLTASAGSGLIQGNTIFSNAATSQPLAGFNPTDPTDAETLGGLIVSAEITYDVDGDGEFDATTDDQDYQVLLYVQPVSGTQVADCNSNGVDDATDIADGTSNDFNADGVPDECQLNRLCADVNDSGVVDSSDFFAWVAAFGSGDPSADVNNSGAVDGSDFFAWVSFFNLGQNGPLCPTY